MLVSAISKTLTELFSPPFRGVLWKSIGLTIALFVALWFALEALASVFLLPLLGPWPWVATAIAWLLGTGLVIGMGFLVAPVTSVFAGVFLDDIAETVERNHYPADPPGRAVPLATSVWIAVRFFALVLFGNIVALILVLFLGLGAIIFFVVNGYLLGREYFLFAAMRGRSEEEANALRSRYEGMVFLGGLTVAALLAVPILNLLAPLYAGALMVHLHKAVEKREGGAHQLASPS